MHSRMHIHIIANLHIVRRMESHRSDTPDLEKCTETSCHRWRVADWVLQGLHHTGRTQTVEHTGCSSGSTAERLQSL